MADNKKGSGKTINIATASAAIVSGRPCVQEGWFGIPLGSADSGASFELGIEGRWRIAVPASTVKGDFLFLPGAKGVLTEDANVVADLTRTSANSNSPVVKAMEDRDAVTGLADVLILPPGASGSALQV